jgi:hypothetical protein
MEPFAPAHCRPRAQLPFLASCEKTASPSSFNRMTMIHCLTFGEALLLNGIITEQYCCWTVLLLNGIVAERYCCWPVFLLNGIITEQYYYWTVLLLNITFNVKTKLSARIHLGEHLARFLPFLSDLGDSDEVQSYDRLSFTFLLTSCCCIVIDFFSNNQPHTLIIPILFCYKTLHVSGIFSAHHQEFYTVHRHW